MLEAVGCRYWKGRKLLRCRRSLGEPLGDARRSARSVQQLDVYFEGAIDLQRAPVARGEPEPVLVGCGTNEGVMDAPAGDVSRLELAEERRSGSSAEEPAMGEA